jgi:DNA polymerase-4
MGIKTIGDLARSDPNLLTEAFGVMGIQLCLMSHGIDDSEVEEIEGIKSVSHEITSERRQVFSLVAGYFRETAYEHMLE